jgi:hypothetical protein
MADFAPSKASTEVVEDSARLMDRTWETIQKKSEFLDILGCVISLSIELMNADSVYELDE